MEGETSGPWSHKPSQRLSSITADHSYATNLRGDVTAKPRDIMEMTGSCNQQYESEMYGDVSSSDDDSLSLLWDRETWQSIEVVEYMDISDLYSQVGIKEQNEKVEVEINRLKPPEPGISSCTKSVAGPADSTTQSGNSKASQCLKFTKKRLNKRDAKGENLLHKACKKNDLEQVKMLIQAGISVNMEDYAGWTALHEASLGDEAVVKELLKAGANVNARSFDGVTPLNDAVMSGNYQVVKLLLQHGANPSDRTVGGRSAMDMAEDETMKELLSFPGPSVIHELPREAPTHQEQPGDPSSEARCHQQLSCQSSFNKANKQSRESGDRDGAREPGDIQLRKKDTTTDYLSHPEAITAVLEEMGKKLLEIWTWPLTGPEDAGRYNAALTQIQNVLMEVLSKHRMEKENLAQKSRSVPDYLRHRVLKSQLASLASRQRNLKEILQLQSHLVEKFVTMKAKLSTQPPNHQDSTVVRQQPDLVSTPVSYKAREEHSCGPNGHRKESLEPLTRTSVLGSILTFPTPPVRSAMNASVVSYQSSAPQAGNTLQHINFQMKGNNALIQTRAEDNSKHLSSLIQRGVMEVGSLVSFFVKHYWLYANVLEDGSLKDKKGRKHPTPEQWLEVILGNNIPVSSSYAWEKVMFKNKPLSHYFLNGQTEGPEDDVRRCAAAPSQQALTPEAVTLSLMKIQIIHLVDDAELLPNAMMDCYWEKLLKNDCSESDDWGTELL
ncbi:ankyrin repeat domain-containing protein 31-like isoform X2 [Sander lucioperca]|uniref:ankyrin repeat domain-containing protein 31-like isoform X2 n=1 Tax=Sander lucioperca TaxID=283035 RepID=UPI00125E2099|nr:ankyrin repeat domain-containing protein 31-like isoform X2 [Sander lucioperca]